MGCVSYGRDCFANGHITAAAYQQACNRARVETSHIRYRYNAQYWSEAVGSSGTPNAIDAILTENGWSDGGITRSLGGVGRARHPTDAPAELELDAVAHPLSAHYRGQAHVNSSDAVKSRTLSEHNNTHHGTVA